jgi:hypothetical protein
MPTPRLIYLTEQQYQAFVTAEDEKNNTTAAAELPTRPRIHLQSSFPIGDDATRNASSNNKKPSAVGGVKMGEQSDDHEEAEDDYVDTLLQEAIDAAVNTRSFVRHDAVRDQHVSSDEEESEDESSLLEFVDKVQQFQHEMVSSDEESENESDSSSLEFVDAGVQHIVGEKRLASSASKDMLVAAGETRRSKRVKVAVKVAPAYYVPAEEESALEAWSYASRSKRVKVAVKVAPAYYVPAEEESLEAWSYASSGVVIKNTALASSPLDESSATADSEITPMNGSNEDADTDSSQRVLAVATATRTKKRSWVHKTFDERFKDLMAFKAEFGHCNVPRTNSINNKKYWSLGKWCGHVRISYESIKEGGTPRSYKLSKSDMKRLENAGFEWCRLVAVAAATSANQKSWVQKTFDEHFKDLMVFKAKFGHCNVPKTQPKNNSKRLPLGTWCNNIRQAYKAIQNGSNPGRKLSKADIKRLENAGFEWKMREKKFTFDDRFNDLMAFKAEFGHCNVPKTNSRNNKKYHSLGQWCGYMRISYKTIKEGGIRGYKLSKSDIQRLENAGFEWNLSKRVPFDERFNDLMAFKAEFGHCNVPSTRSSNYKKYYSLGVWCINARRSYKAIQEGGMLRYKLSEADIKRLEKAGFVWHFNKIT